MFYGSGAVYVPASNKFIHFVGGKYETSDEAEIVLLYKKYKHDARTVAEPLYKEPIEKLSESDSKPKRGRKPKNEPAEI